MQTLDQINFTIGSTSESDPLSVCMDMHRSTLVYIYTYGGFSFVSLPEKPSFFRKENNDNRPEPYFFIGKNTMIALNPIYS